MSAAYSAYLSEIYRAGIEAIDRGQTEAALSLGMSRVQVMRIVVLPQAFRIVIPPIGSGQTIVFAGSISAAASTCSFIFRACCRKPCTEDRLRARSALMFRFRLASA